MALYYGVVRDNRVELENDVRLADGLRVEIRPRVDETLVQRLRESGLLEELPDDQTAPDESFEPIHVSGRLLSEQIVAERR